VIHTDGWLGYEPLEKKGRHTVTSLRGPAESPSELMPRVHLVVSPLKRWLVGSHQGAVSHIHLDYYLDEFTFRFNRRRSRSRGKLFLRLVQHAVNIEPVPWARIVQARKAHDRQENLSQGDTQIAENSKEDLWQRQESR
jgi:hypothetical protein